MKTIALKKAILHLRNDGILHIHIKPHADMQLEDAAKIVETMGKIGNGKKFPVLIDAGEFANIDKDVRIFSASPERIFIRSPMPLLIIRSRKSL